jgi:hypothetical protein
MNSAHYSIHFFTQLIVILFSREEIDSDATEAISRDFDSSLLMTSQSLTSQKFPTSRLGVDTKQTNVRLLAIEILAPFFQADEFVLKCIYEVTLLYLFLNFFN